MPKVSWIATAAIVLLLPIFLYPLQLSDEPRVAHTSLQMVQSGEFAVPTVNGEPFLQTPPLCYWLLGGWLRIVGYEPDGLARVVPVMAALGTVALTALLMARYVGAGAGFLSAAILISLFQFWEISHRIVSDMVLTFFTTLGFSSFVRLALDESPRARAGVAMGLGIGAAFLTKGLPGPVFLGVTVVATFLLHRSVRTRGHVLALLVAVLVATAVVLPWILSLYRVDPSYPSTLLVEHVWKRATQGGLHNPNNWQFFHRMLLHTLPWAPLLLCVVGVRLWGLRRWPRQRGMLLNDLFLFFFLLPFVLLLCSRSKRNLYLLPTLPALAMLLASWLEPHLYHPRVERGARIAVYILAVAGILGIGAVFATTPGSASSIAWVVLVVFLYWLLRWWRTRARALPLGGVGLPASITMLLLCIAVVVSAWGAFVFTLRSPKYSADELGRVVVERERSGHEVVGYALTEREVGATAWYLRHPFTHLQDEVALVEFLRDDRARKSALVIAVDVLASLKERPTGFLLETWKETARPQVRRRTLSVLVPFGRTGTAVHEDREKSRENVEADDEIDEKGATSQ